eukprot:CAMPEP_0114523542 /NCGR_PEP_ID=MMETSP0109-20121206/21347_1 /TAXON_ID=29199 /ORGANISM="Chlorarachnion reptans, Strain CCCM449" /LENGTH=735 /DNA_ID=CAMNT_0001704865 /DNA_START=61 /DNA_END=2268 /DNA_ORIENTATION=-
MEASAHHDEATSSSSSCSSANVSAGGATIPAKRGRQTQPTSSSSAPGPANAGEADVFDGERKLEVDETLLQLVEDTGRNPFEWKLDDRLRAPWTTGTRLYNGHIAEVHAGGGYTVRFDDGDIRNFPDSSTFVRDTVFNIAEPLLAVDETTVVTCTERVSTLHPLEALFSAKSETEWKVPNPKLNDRKLCESCTEGNCKKSPKLVIRFSDSKRYFITKVVVDTKVEDPSETTTDFRLNVATASSRESDLIGDFFEAIPDQASSEKVILFRVGCFVRALVFRFPCENRKRWVSLKSIQLFHRRGQSMEEKLLPSLENAGFISLLDDSTFADCVIQTGPNEEDAKLESSTEGKSRRRIPCHKCILASQSLCFRRLLLPSYENDSDAKSHQQIVEMPTLIPASSSDDYRDTILVPEPHDTVVSMIKLMYDQPLSLAFNSLPSGDDFHIQRAIKLWLAAERYEIPKLQRKMEDLIRVRLNVDAAIVACQQTPNLEGHQELREILISYLAKNIDAAMVKREFVQIRTDFLHKICTQSQMMKRLQSAYDQPVRPMQQPVNVGYSEQLRRRIRRMLTGEEAMLHPARAAGAGAGARRQRGAARARHRAYATHLERLVEEQTGGQAPPNGAVPPPLMRPHRRGRHARRGPLAPVAEASNRPNRRSTTVQGGAGQQPRADANETYRGFSFLESARVRRAVREEMRNFRTGLVNELLRRRTQPRELRRRVVERVPQGRNVRRRTDV